MNPEGVNETLRELLAALDEARLEFALIGGYAVGTWGIPRATYDVDVLVRASPDRLDALFEACEHRGFIIDESFKKGWIDRIRDMPLVKVGILRDGRPIHADVFLVSTPFQVSAFARRITVQSPLLQRAVPMIAAADLLLFKLMANRPKDLVDVQNILCVQGVPDDDYLKEWASRLGVAERLSRAIEAAGLRPTGD